MCKEVLQHDEIFEVLHHDQISDLRSENNRLHYIEKRCLTVKDFKDAFGEVSAGEIINKLTGRDINKINNNDLVLK
jgi:hypothetical protein